MIETNSNAAKSALLEIGRRMYARGFVAANDGNLSVRVSDESLWITPTGVSKGFLTEEVLLRIDLKGHVLEGTEKPSSETAMHLRIYSENPAVMAVVHAHPPYATAFAVAGLALDDLALTEMVQSLGQVPLAPYATPGSIEVADAVAPFCRDYAALLLQNHGALTWGKNLTEAWYRMETVEASAQVLYLAKFGIGRLAPFTAEQALQLSPRLW
ncbi:MAG: class II aldolase/adducin family protein [Oscillospiraceae bacterium]